MSAIAHQPPTANSHGGEYLSPFNQSVMDDPECYRRWRAQKLARVRCFLDAPLVEIGDPLCLEKKELSALGERIAAMNFALYRIKRCTPDDSTFSHRVFINMCRQVGLERLVANPFAHSSGISEIQVATDTRQRAYIPYDNRALNWHTDGYYHPPATRINAFAMHTVRPAASGGENQFLDHEILYLRLRDRDPTLAACLFAPDVMTIPPGTHAFGAARAAHTGAVFSNIDGSGRLHMGYTLRKHNIHWKSSRLVQAALGSVRAILEAEDNPFVLTRRFAAGEGVISNNVLHNRTAFANSENHDGLDGKSDGRLVLRARFYDSIGDAIR